MEDDRWVWAVCLGTTALLAAAANSLALFVFQARPALRTLANRFVINLLGGNLACAIILGPLLVADRAQLLPPSSASCAAAEGASAFFCMAAVLAILLVAADQYLAVTDPLRYHTRVSCARSLLMIGSQWTLSVLFGMVAALTPQPVPSPWTFCKSADIDPYSNLYKNIFSCIYIGFVVISFILICLMYSCISMAAHRSAKPPAPPPALSLNMDPLVPEDNKTGEECIGLLMNCDKKSVGSDLSDGNPPTIEIIPPYEPRLARSLRSVLLDVNKPYPSPLCLKLTHESEKKGLSHDDIYKISQSAPQTTGLKTVRSSPNFGSGECQIIPPTPRPTPSYMTSLRCRISNASLFRYREESRAARISALVVFLALVSQLPAAVLQAAPMLGIGPLVALCIGGCISPFLFAYRSRRVQKELFSLCGRSSKDIYPSAVPLRRTSSLSTERSWRSSRINSSQAALRLLRSLAAENETSNRQSHVFTSCPPGKSILKRVRAQSRRWGRRPRRCKFSTDSNQRYDGPSYLGVKTCSNSLSSPVTPEVR